MIDKVVELILEGKEEEAARLVIEEMTDIVTKKLHIWFGYTENEARTILNDAIVDVIIPKVKKQIVKQLNKKYIESTCMNLAHNMVRKSQAKKTVKLVPISKFQSNYYRIYTQNFDEYTQYANSFMDGFSYDPEIEGNELEQILDEALNMMDDKCKKHIELKYKKEHSHIEIADILNLESFNSSKTLLSRCMNKLRKHFEYLRK